ncbi:hypothetical protein LRS05_01585 [Flavobacterium sp. J372]|uniref:hypothetical protein n=1 Tax=Flavobacterium sp. J372 TaxID=2898436 RepID=UPI002150BFE3|nr:hypothetical protein [Flavobacterium sp. J372]MCR5860915.1 hypothetical protein [Flavobacterium sp. J372]
MKNVLPLLVLIMTFISCSKTEPAETVNVGGRYSLDLPKSFKKAKGLNPEASLEYMDAANRLYVIVIDEQKDAVINAIVENGLENTYSPDLNGYSQLLADTMKPNLKAGTIEPFKDTIINGLKARKTDLEGIVENLRIHYKLGVVEGKNRFYQIMTWTAPDDLQKNQEEMQAIINSFKETDRSVAK